jgi:methylaspartate ammonia-lyase
MDDLTNALRLFCQLQSLIHTIDELSDSVRFKHELKKRSKSYSLTIERLLNDLQKDMNIEEIENYSKIVTELDNLIKTVKITSNETI